MSAAIREAEDADAAAIIGLIGAVFAEYPGCVMDADEMPELYAPRTAFVARGGRFWVAEDDRGDLIACVGWKPATESAPAGGVELCKLYVARAARRRGLGGALYALVEGETRARGAAFVELWSDTRFEDAHRLYARRGYARGPRTRELHDRSDTVEFYFRLSLSDAAPPGPAPPA